MDCRVVWSVPFYFWLMDRALMRHAIGTAPADDSTPPTKKSKKIVINLSTDKFGYPVLPPKETYKDKTGEYKRILIGAFMTDTYRAHTVSFYDFSLLSPLLTGLCTGRRKAAVPWKDMGNGNSDAFIDPIYLPEGIHLTQYHHFRVADCNKLLLHWANRKAAGAVVFRFKSTVTREENEDFPEYDGEESSEEKTAESSEDDTTGNDRSVSWLLKLGGRY